MPRFTTKSEEQIFAQQLARVVARSDLSDVSDVSPTKHVLRASSRQDGKQYYEMSLLLQLFALDSATGEDLDERAKDLPPGTITRILSRQGVVQLVFIRAGTTGTVAIPIGTKVKTSGNVIFTTTTTGTITPTSAEQISGHGAGRDSNLVSATADEGGVAGNAGSGTIIRFVARPPGVNEVTNPSAGQFGRDKESDDDFRKRIQDYIAGLARCPVLAIEAGIIGQEDPISGAAIVYAKVVEDIVDRGEVYAYVDDGTGSAETTEDVATAIAAVLTWNGTTTVTTADTSEIAADDWIRLDSDEQWFQIASIVPNTSATILNPGSDSIPTGATSSSLGLDIITEGLAVGDVAVGGETRIDLDYEANKEALSIFIASTINGNLTEGTDFVWEPTTGKLKFLTALVAGEQLVADYTRYTGLIAFAQKVINGDRDDRTTYPGFRAAGVRVWALPPQIQIQTIEAVVTVAEGFVHADVIGAAVVALRDFVNGLSISNDVLRAKLISVLMAVPGVTNVDLITPADDVILLDEQLARTTDSNIDVR